MKKLFCSLVSIGYIFMLISVFALAEDLTLVLGAAAIAVAFLAVMIFGKRFDDLLERRYAVFAAVILAFAAFLQCSHIELLRFTPTFDLAGIFDGARETVEKGDFSSYYGYFGSYFNNYGSMRLLYHVFRVGRLFSSDYFLIAAVFNEITILLTFLFSSLITRKLFGARFGLLTLLFFISMPPFIFMTDVFYTDSLSMLYPVLLIYLAMINRNRTRLVHWLICIAFAVFAFIGGSIKANVYVVPIAVCIVELIYKHFERFLQYLICLLVLCISFHALSMGHLYRNYIPKEELEKTKTPIIHWIMMGLGETGRYSIEDEAFTRSFDDPDERDSAIVQKIGERLKGRGITGMISLFRDKSFIDFGDGTLGLSDFLDDGPVNDSQLQDHILYERPYYKSYYSWCCAIFYAILILGGVGVISETAAKNISRGKTMFLPALAFFGDYAFLMIWEATQRYCTNFIPLIMILASGGVYYAEKTAENSKLLERASKFLAGYKRETSVFLGAFASRIGIYLLSFFILIILKDQGQFIHLKDFTDGWLRWDAFNYLRIAQDGYKNSWAVENGSMMFLPLYPWLVAILHKLISDSMVCALLISSVCFSFGCIFFDKLVRKEFGTKKGGYILIALLCFPFSFFFGAVGTEALFFLLGSMFFWYLRNHRWKKTAIVGALACMTQIQGLLFFIPLVSELIYHKKGITLIRKKKMGEFFRRLGIPFAINLLMIVGFSVYLILNAAVAGNAFYFTIYKNPIDSFFLKTISYILRLVRDTWGNSEWFCIWLPEAVIFVLFILCIVFMIRRKMRPTYWIYLIAYGIILYSSSWLLNGPRLTLGALPIFMAIGCFTGEKPQKRQWVLFGSAFLSVVYLMAYMKYLPIL